MAKDLGALQKALEGKKVVAAPATAPQPMALPAGYKAPSREGKVNVTAYLHPDFKRSLRYIQAKTGASLQELVSEALNDLFDKHQVPTVNL
jgi:hypothetical protein